MSATSRPPALRVPVTDVVSRTSLVTPVPPRGSDSQPPMVAVVQRAVRIISDPPPAMLNPPTPHPASGEGPYDSEPTVTIESATPPRGANERAMDYAAADQSGYRPVEQSGYAAMEMEQLELADELSDGEDGASFDDSGFDDSGFEDEAEEENEIEVSVPPPAPPEALRSSPAEAAEEERRPSGEFEELEVDAEERTDPGYTAADGRAVAPPPPPVGRISVPEPPDLGVVARSAARVQELRPTRPRPHAWWEIFFDDDYLRTVRPPTREQIARQCDLIEKRLGLRPGATLLDVGCGLGLQVLELSARGYLGVGLDLSLPMLSRASEEAQMRSLRVNFLHSDMREMSFDGAFDAVLCLGTTLGYFDDDTNRRIVERLHRALKPGGLLLLDLVNRDHVIRSQPNLIWFEGDGCVCMEESEFNFFTSRLHIKRTVILDSGRQTENEYSLRLYSLHELGQLLNGIGFRVKDVSGRDALPGVFFGQESPSLVIVAERRLQQDTE
jgi:SAM-dependent methyltransferase